MPNPAASAKFKRKPDQIDAVSVSLILTSKPSDYPQWIIDAFTAKTVTIEGGTLIVLTSEGPKPATSGDMLVKNDKGWLAVYKLDDFNAKFEAVTPGP